MRENNEEPTGEEDQPGPPPVRLINGEEEVPASPGPPHGSLLLPCLLTALATGLPCNRNFLGQSREKLVWSLKNKTFLFFDRKLNLESCFFKLANNKLEKKNRVV